jgi:hypothetical protein
LTDVTGLPCTSAAFAGLSADILRHGKSLRFRARGASMHPLVQDGDTLLVHPLDAGVVRVGDVVLCSSGLDRVLVHRVLHRRMNSQGYSYLVQGDQMLSPDGWIPQAQVYGQVAGIERAGKRIDMRRPVMRVLGWLAVLRSHWHTARGEAFRHTR